MSESIRPSKKLIEVALPLEAINAACKADKERKTGHIRNIHKWFAPMPLPALRAVICAVLLDAPHDEHSRLELLELIEDLVASGPEDPPGPVLSRARKLLRPIAERTGAFVLDPFCGGGSTLVEGQRLGLDVEGSDLNPIPVMISRALTVLPKRNRGRKSVRDKSMLHATDDLAGFQADIRSYAEQVRASAAKLIGSQYPKAPNGDTVVYWWWAHAVPSPDPAFKHCWTPLVTSWWLSRRSGDQKFLVPEPDPNAGKISFRVETHGSPPIPSKDRCVFSKAPITYKYVREEAQQGRLRRMLLAFVSDGQHGRKYWPADSTHIEAADVAAPDLPPLEIPPDGLGISVQNYGIRDWAELFLPRQQRMLAAFAGAIRTIPAMVNADGGDAQYGRDIATFIGLCFGKLVQASSTIVRLNVREGMTAKAEPAFARGDIQLNWDFAETNPFGASVGDWSQVVTTALRAYGLVNPTGAAMVRQADVRDAGVEHPGRYIVVTDPPYFAAIGYADLSGYFYYWIRQALRDVLPEIFATVNVPITTELIASSDRQGGKEAAAAYFINGFKDALTHLGNVSHPEFPLVVVYAQQQEEQTTAEGPTTGWEAMLEAILQAGLSITGTWPVWGARSARMRGIGSNSLASYIVLVCRPERQPKAIGTRREFVTALRAELPVALSNLRQASVAPVDLAQAAIGPGMAIFTRYEKVLDSSGKALAVRDALSLINQALDEIQAEAEGDFDADTRWAVAWFEHAGFAEADYGLAEQLSKAKNTSISGLVGAGILRSKGGQVRLIRPEELPTGWDPLQDSRLTVWEALHYLIQRLAKKGEPGAAELAATLGGVAENARDLAYRLYTICERKKRTQEAAEYNALVQSWPEITRLAREGVKAQVGMFT